MTKSQIFSFAIGLALFMGLYSYRSSPPTIKQSLTDTVPPKQYVLTYERNSLFVQLDSLVSLGRYLGTALTKDQWIEVMTIYNRVIYRIPTLGKLDSIPSPKQK